MQVAPEEEAVESPGAGLDIPNTPARSPSENPSEPRLTSPSTAAAPSRMPFVFGVLNALSGLVLLVGVFGVVPTRHWLLDSLAALIIIVQWGSAVGLLWKQPWALRALAIAAWSCFGLGLTLLFFIVLTMVFLRGVHGSYGPVALAVAGLIVALLVPYVLVVPALELLWLRQRTEPES